MKRNTPLGGPISRRQLLRLGAGGLGLLAGGHLLRDQMSRPGELTPAIVEAAELAQTLAPKYHMAGTDGWISLPVEGFQSIYHPDLWAPTDPAGLTTYMFGFVDVTGLNTTEANVYKMQCQAPAPVMYFQQDVPATTMLSNLGLQMRPDLIDAHTIHWHGFRNALPIFDGEPFSSVSVPIGRNFTYYFHPRDPGTYMYHCHVEDTEHVSMGMTGVIVVQPTQNGNTTLYPSGRYAYNDGNGITGYDREFNIFLSEVWNETHWDDAHVQLPDWSDYVADFVLLNGRVYPETLLPDHDINSNNSNLKYQPYTSLIEANAGERVLLRFVNLGFTYLSMTLPGIKMRVVGKDATLLQGRDGTDISFYTNTITVGPGESVDAIFEAPAVVSGPDTYLLYNRNYDRASNNGAASLGSATTEVRIYSAGSLADQPLPA
jgi:FtsP/CotA-like multicopper oxidase with cupredoxin domain